MQTPKKWAVCGATVILAATIGTAGAISTAEADGGSTPGSVDDPIVTKAYVDATVAKLVKQELEKVGSGSGAASSELEVVTVPWGSKLIVGDGGEMIVRSGKAIAYSSDANGLSDLTDGTDIKPGKPVGNNHLILNPRGERGVEADPKQGKGLIVLVRGGYKLQQ
ncbi:hypothetical protein [Cohnella phaseoli]|uniref:Copper amine oxidase-like protein n=1 Tax=Cohnella phaseoli TaxID=456490 RepID=A0A3D9KCK4_9BACL|nr:hypothetical protein [Cohnella phaseoli]RED84023.1 hypothetical protein DFP98_107131 [Cohnella phaseoli]